MAEQVSIEELTTLYEQVSLLKVENERLKTQAAIDAMNRELEQFQGTSTPNDGPHFDLGARPKSQRKLPHLPETPPFTPFPVKPITNNGCVQPTAIRTSSVVSDVVSEPVRDINRFVTERRKPRTTSTAPKQTSAPDKQCSKPSLHMKPATYDGTGSWQDYKAHFEICANINRWSDKEKGLYLAVSLRGQAQGILGTASESFDYVGLRRALQNRFAPPNQTELYRVQLKERRQKATESLSEMAQDIRRLACLEYPSAPTDVKETLAKEQFIDSLHSSDMRLRIKQSRPSDLNDAVRLAVELEAFNRAETKMMEGRCYICSATTEHDSKADVCMKEIVNLKQIVSELSTNLSSLIQSNASFRPAAGNSQPNHIRKRRNNGKGSGTKRHCFECGDESHIRPECPKLKKTTGSSGYKQSGNDDQQSKHVASIGSGLYLGAEINDRPIELLIDSGATLSLISTAFWNRVKTDETKLKPFKTNIMTASGSPIGVKGRASVRLSVKGTLYMVTVAVAEIDTDGILGLDFMTDHNCSLNVAQRKLEVHGITHDLCIRGKIGCYRVTLTEKVEVPARTEMIVSGTVKLPFLPLEDELTIIEQAERTTEDGRGLIARTVVQPKETVPVRLLNISDEMQIIYPGTHIADMNFVSAVVEPHMVAGITKTDKTAAPAHLEQLYEKTVSGMTPDQKKEVAKLLLKHAETFSKYDEDIGLTGIIRHSIPTGDARPIKQPLRRIPVHMHAEVI